MVVFKSELFSGSLVIPGIAVFPFWLAVVNCFVFYLRHCFLLPFVNFSLEIMITVTRGAARLSRGLRAVNMGKVAAGAPQKARRWPPE